MSALPAAGKLYIRLDATAPAGAPQIAFAHPPAEPGGPFAYTPCTVTPGAALAVSLRHALSRKLDEHAAATEAEVIICGPATVVPLAEFQENDADTYYHYLFHPATGGPERVFYDSLPAAAGAVLLFAAGTEICRTLEQMLAAVHYTSAHTALIRHYARRGAEKASPRLFINLQGTRLCAYAFNGQSLLHMGAYTAPTAADAAYFCLSLSAALWPQASATPEGGLYITGGTADAREALSNELRRYTSAPVFASSPVAEYRRHPVTRLNGVPYDLLTALLS